MILRFCVIGNSESIFLKAFLLSVAKRYQYSSFQVLTPKSTTFKYPENIQQFVYSEKGKLFSKISKSSFFFHLINQWIFFRNSIVFDVCHIHSVGTASSILATLMAKKCRFIISSVWGSDFYRSSRMKRRIQEKLYLVSRFITFSNEKSLLEFDNYYAGKYSQKLKICRFGLTAFEELKNLEFDKSYCKRQLNIPDSDLVITIGYNNSPGQQHIKVIESLVKHKKMLPSKLLFILPMTYGGTEKYRELVRRKLESSGFRYRIYDSFIPDREISMLRKASDIMIQVQITDQLSGSMLEHLYAENIIITGNWLPYAILDESGVFMHKVLSVDEVGEELLYILNDFNLFEERCKANPEIVQSFLDLENNMKSWIDMYEELGFEESSRVRGS